MELLEALRAEPYTTELVRFQLEINDDPLVLEGHCLGRLERRLAARIEAVRIEAALLGAEVVLAGILPTLTMSDLTLANMSPRDRYRALNDTLSRLCGGSYQLHIQGSEELNLEFDSVMLEGCNSSFQVHLQVAGDEFARHYNAAQLVTAPVLAAAASSPLLFGKRLWDETRISLFQQSIDTRGASRHLRQLASRVRFGERWVEGSVLDVYREDVARFPALLTAPVTERSLDVLAGGGVPKLEALQLYNGTLYRWNRPCYGVLEGRPHLRIECRVLPAGPSLVDEVANAALWIGSVLGAASHIDDVPRRMQFADARSNLLSAARHGLHAGFTWVDGRSVNAREAILQELLPLAREGLESVELSSRDVDRYLGVVEERVRSGQTGARWFDRSLASLDAGTPRAEQMTILTASLVERQKSAAPCHQWGLASADAVESWHANYQRVEQYMTTDLYTVKEDELVDLAALVMNWKQVRQLPVEDDRRRLVGVVSFGSVLRQLASGEAGERGTTLVRTIMQRDPPTVEPETSTLEAMRLMRQSSAASLPVVKNGELVGIVSITDFLPIAERLLIEKLGRGGEPPADEPAE
jgi:CBS domain-containing protein